MGCVSTGVDTVELTASSAPASCAIFAVAAMSVIVHSGLAGVSIHTSLVRPGRGWRPRSPPGRQRPQTWARCPAGASRLIQSRRPQYITLGATTWAGRSSAKNAIVAAVMPEATTRAPAPPSSNARLDQLASAVRQLGHAAIRSGRHSICSLGRAGPGLCVAWKEKHQ